MECTNKVYKIFLIILLLGTIVKTDFVSRYKTNIEMLTICPNNEQLEAPYRNFKFVYVNRTHKAWSYDITFPKPVGHDVGYEISLQKWTNGGWGYSMPILPYQNDICSAYHTYFRKSNMSYLRAIGVKHPEDCPIIPPGNYSLKNYSFYYDYDGPVWTGRLRFKAVASRGKNGPQVMCTLVIFTIEEML